MPIPYKIIKPVGRTGVPRVVKGQTVQSNLHPGYASAVQNYRPTSATAKALRRMGANPNNMPSLLAAAGGGGRGGGGGGRKVAQTWQEQLQSLYNSIYSNMETPAQQAKRIQQGINANIAAETAANRATLADTLAANREVTRAQQSQLANQQARAMGFSRAIGSLTEGEGKSVYSDYERAAQNIQGLGTGLSGAVLDSQQAAANAAARGLEQASGGVNTVGSSFDLEGLKNTTQYLGTTAPARDLFSEAANQAAGARLRNVASAQSIRNLAEDYGRKGVEAGEVLAGEQRKANTAFAGEQRKLQATRPDLYMKAVEAARSGYRQDAATATTALTLANTAMATTADIENSKNVTKIAEMEATAATDAAKIKSLNDTIKANATAAKNNVDAADTISKSTGYQPDGKTLRPGYFLPGGPGTVPQPYKPDTHKVVKNADGTQRLVPVPQPTTGGGSGGGTPKLPNGQTVDQAYSTIDTRSGDLNDAVLLPPFAQITNGRDVSRRGDPPIYKPLKSYKIAYQLALAKFPAAYKKNKDLMAQIKSSIDTALAMAGYKVPGK